MELTKYNYNGGCGCKIAPDLLDIILQTSYPFSIVPELLVNNNAKDDAAAYDLCNGTSILSTTDFFLPIVDDPFEFGRIAAANAISDIYAMGGKPLMAIVILGWPVKKLSLKVAHQVIKGGHVTCYHAGIPLAGGHSINTMEPIFGLAVTGLINNKNLKRNNTAQPDCKLFLTKPLGIGILSTARKKKVLKPTHQQLLLNTMYQLNTIGQKLAEIPEVLALTDITGFGLLGHLSEVCEGSSIGALIDYKTIPYLSGTTDYLKMGCVPHATIRNFKNYSSKVSKISNEQQQILFDPQTSGGLLIVIRKEGIKNLFNILTKKELLNLSLIGRTTKPRKDGLLISIQ